VESVIWATVLDQRGLPSSLTAHLFRIGENQMRALIKQVRPLLQQHGHQAEPLPIRLIDASELGRYVMHATSTRGQYGVLDGLADDRADGFVLQLLAAAWG
jgi:hypothetical protein